MVLALSGSPWHNFSCVVTWVPFLEAFSRNSDKIVPNLPVELGRQKCWGGLRLCCLGFGNSSPWSSGLSPCSLPLLCCRRWRRVPRLKMSPGRKSTEDFHIPN